MSRPLFSTIALTTLVVAFALFWTSPKPSQASTAVSSSGAVLDLIAAKGQSGVLNTWIRALEAAGLTERLDGAAPYTVFAPSDDAFAKLPADRLEALLRPENRGQLIAVLSDHLVPGRMTWNDVVGRAVDLETAAGTELSIDAVDDLSVNNANVLIADIEARNGVIHVVDSVVVPN